MNVAEWLAAQAARCPSAPALLVGDRVVADYAGFAAAAAAFAAHLAERGVAPGDRVALYLTNSPRYLECLFGTWWAGAVAVPVNRKLVPAERDVIAADAGAAVLVTDDDVTDDGAGGWRGRAGPAAPVTCAPEDVAWLFYTSGTTGRPKGATLTHANLVAMALCQLADVDPVGPGEAYLYAAPLSHGAGLYGLAHVRCGSRHVFPPSGGFDAGEVLDLARAVRDLSLFAAPTMVRRLVREARASGADGAGLKTVIYGGGPMYLADIQEAVAVLGERFVQIYGQGESPMTITVLPRADHTGPAERLASVGYAQSAVQVRVCDPGGAPVPAGVVGEIEVRGATVMAGYWNDPVSTAAALRDGWLRTGDLGRLTPDGYLTLEGRSKEVVVTGGSNVYPREVEDVLVAHPGVAEAAVVGRRDAEWGEIVVAFVVAAGEPPGSEELDRHCLHHLARFKRPRHYEFVPELPRNAYGKVQKFLLRPAEAQR
jgi:acyl-CoA synthetase (AMP-forming)/AMP-acid ligase II